MLESIIYVLVAGSIPWTHFIGTVMLLEKTEYDKSAKMNKFYIIIIQFEISI